MYFLCLLLFFFGDLAADSSNLVHTVCSFEFFCQNPDFVKIFHNNWISTWFFIYMISTENNKRNFVIKKLISENRILQWGLRFDMKFDSKKFLKENSANWCQQIFLIVWLCVVESAFKIPKKKGIGIKIPFTYNKCTLQLSLASSALVVGNERKKLLFMW